MEPKLEMVCSPGRTLYHSSACRGGCLCGLWYTLVEIQDIALSTDGKIAFKVPARKLYPERPTSLKDMEKQKNAQTGFTRVELFFQGQLENDDLILRCTSGPIDCPEDVMVFRKGRWSQH